MHLKLREKEDISSQCGLEDGLRLSRSPRKYCGKLGIAGPLRCINTSSLVASVASTIEADATQAMYSHWLRLQMVNPKQIKVVVEWNLQLNSPQSSLKAWLTFQIRQN